jgi:uncharacterized protein Yka (UPF0111/DUF47 family)
VLLGIVLLLGGGASTKIFMPGVSRSACKEAQKNIKELNDVKLDDIKDRLERIEHKIDQNGKP